MNTTSTLFYIGSFLNIEYHVLTLLMNIWESKLYLSIIDIMLTFALQDISYFQLVLIFPLVPYRHPLQSVIL